MKKLVLLAILLLILTTSLVKNSTKTIEDKIFVLNENIRSLKEELGDVTLEYNYLSSPNKLIKYQSQYFEDELIKTDITKLKIINSNNDSLEITDLIDKLQKNEQRK